MAYSKKRSTSRNSSSRRYGSRRRTSGRAGRSQARYQAKARRKKPARKRYRRTVKPQKITIELVNAPAPGLSPIAQQMEKMKAATEPKKARF